MGINSATLGAAKKYVDSRISSSGGLIGGKGDKGDPGKDGITPQLQKSTTAIQVSTDEGKTFSDLVLLSEIKGDKGDKGDKGETGSKGDKGDTGKDGISVTISSVVENTEDEGSNTITFSDGKTITIKNGSKGESGDKGENGKDGISPTITENENNTEEIYKLDITNGEETITTPNLKGEDGSGINIYTVDRSTNDNTFNSYIAEDNVVIIITGFGWDDWAKFNVRGNDLEADGDIYEQMNIIKNGNSIYLIYYYAGGSNKISNLYFGTYINDTVSVNEISLFNLIYTEYDLPTITTELDIHSAYIYMGDNANIKKGHLFALTNSKKITGYSYRGMGNGIFETNSPTVGSTVYLYHSNFNCFMPYVLEEDENNSNRLIVKDYVSVGIHWSIPKNTVLDEEGNCTTVQWSDVYDAIYAENVIMNEVSGMDSNNVQDAIEELNMKIENSSTASSSNILSGSLASIEITANSYKDFTVSFSKVFSALPTVVGTLTTTSTDAGIGNMSVVVVGTATSGCTFRIFNASDSDFTVGVKWMAYLV